jgi:hypothetical protein
MGGKTRKGDAADQGNPPDPLASALFIERMKTTHVTLILEKYHLGNILLASAPIISSIETGHVSQLTRNLIDTVVLPFGMKLKSIMMYEICETAVLRLYELQKIHYFPDLVFDTMRVAWTADSAIIPVGLGGTQRTDGFGPLVVRFLTECKYLKTVNGLEISLFSDSVNEIAWTMSNSVKLYTEILLILFSKRLKHLYKLSLQTFHVLNALGMNPGFSCPRKLTIEAIVHLSLSFLNTKGWKRLNELTINWQVNREEIKNAVLVIPENVKIFEFSFFAPPRYLDISSEQVYLRYYDKLPILYFVEGKVKHITLKSLKYGNRTNFAMIINLMPSSLETLTIFYCDIKSVSTISAFLGQLITKPSFKYLKIHMGGFDQASIISLVLQQLVRRLFNTRRDNNAIILSRKLENTL